jgi:hypothetical protein
MTNTAHPVNSAYNSPIDISSLPGFDINNPNSIVLPGDFWVNQFASTGIYVRIGVFDGTSLAGLSRVMKIKHYGKIFTGVGQYFPFCMPLDDGNVKTVKETCVTINSTGAFFKTNAGQWKYTTPAYLTVDDSPIMDGMRGALFLKPDDEGVISWLGKPWRKEP